MNTPIPQPSNPNREHFVTVFPVTVEFHRDPEGSWVLDFVDINFDVVDTVLLSRVEGFGYVGTYSEPSTFEDDAAVDAAVDLVREALKGGTQWN